MKKIGVVTLNGYMNYGNRLQNYAVTKILQNKNYEVETIVKNHTVSRYTNITLKRKLKNIVKNPSKYRRKRVLQKRREREFEQFSKKYLNEIFIEDEYVDINNNAFDMFFVGSDQVWNPHYINDFDYYLLQFAPRDKRNSFAASFGIDKLDGQEEKRFALALSEFNTVTVREKSAFNLIKKLVNDEPVILTDPTMLLPVNIYEEKLSKVKTTKKYVLTYFLGSKTIEQEKFINKIKEKYNLQVIHLNDYDTPEYYSKNPFEFLSLIKESEIFITDSFHGVVFSILFKKNFIVTQRIGKNSMYSRINNILEKFNLREREFDYIKSNHDRIFNTDFTGSESILTEEKRKFDLYFAQNFELK